MIGRRTAKCAYCKKLGHQTFSCPEFQAQVDQGDEDRIAMYRSSKSGFLLWAKKYVECLAHLSASGVKIGKE